MRELTEYIIKFRYGIEVECKQELIRCKDCVECYFASNRIQSEQTFACGKHGIDVTPDFFCADGERK